MVLDTLKDEENGLHEDDELLTTLKEIAEKGAAGRPLDRCVCDKRKIENILKKKRKMYQNALACTILIMFLY